MKQIHYQPPGDESRLCFVIEDVFTKEECEEWISLTEARGYQAALVNVGGGKQALMTDVRNNMRCIIDDEVMANKLWTRIKSFIPKTCKSFNYNYPFKSFFFLLSQKGNVAPLYP